MPFLAFFRGLTEGDRNMCDSQVYLLCASSQGRRVLLISAYIAIIARVSRARETKDMEFCYLAICYEN